ncbi:hypothetical protein [Stutzerimonas stutzeri]|nr:hypothetical protein [Stutzerimonas stutzeri]
MTRFSPVRSQCQFDTPGVSRFAERREYDYFCRGIGIRPANSPTELQH